MLPPVTLVGIVIERPSWLLTVIEADPPPTGVTVKVAVDPAAAAIRRMLLTNAVCATVATLVLDEDALYVPV
jgi:hypothetical protein